MERKSLIQNVGNLYDIGSVISVEPTSRGSGSSYVVKTPSACYILKTAERADFTSIYAHAWPLLNENHLRAPRIIRTNSGALMAENRWVLYEFLPGDTLDALNAKQRASALRSMRSLLHALRGFPLSHPIERVNHWDLAKSYGFIAHKFLPRYGEPLPESLHAAINPAISHLRHFEPRYNALNKQLIHADLGPDNFLFSGDEVSAVIDFTPEYAPELYSLCHFVYWNDLWQVERITRGQIQAPLNEYCGQETPDLLCETFHFLFLQCTLFRAIGPLLDMLHQTPPNFDQVNKRIELVHSVTRLLD